MSVNQEPQKPEDSALKWADLTAKAWPTIRDYAIKFALLKFLPRVVSGPWGWIVSTLLTWSVDHVIKPAYDFGVRKVIILFKRKQNNQAGRDVQNSKTETEFNTTFDDLP